MADRSIYVLDSFALLAYFQAEVSGPTMLRLIESARDEEATLYLNLINAGEVYYLTSREQNLEKAENIIRDLRELPIILLPATEERIWAAARIKSQYPISYADAFTVALAQELKATLVTGDPEFKAVESLIQILWLPRK